MIRPFIYSVCDQGYHDRYGKAFLNSARANGHEAALYCDFVHARTDAAKAHYLAWRARLMPHLVEKHGAVLMVDVDSIITRPVEIEPEYEFGVFMRQHKPEIHLRMLGAAVYCTDRALPFARAYADCMSRVGVEWYTDQVVLLALHNAMCGRYRVKYLDRSFISWKSPAEAPIFTGKGFRKDQNEEFMRAVAAWKEPNANLACVS